MMFTEEELAREEWKQLKNYPGYSVSSLGRVRSDPHEISNGKGEYLSKEKILKPNTLAKGYYQVTIAVDKIRYSRQVHRLVCEAFISNPNNYPQVNHKNGIKNDNRVENLEWCNNSMNQLHAYKMGLNVKHNTWGGKRKQRKIALLTKDGEIERVFDSIPQAARFFGEKTGANLNHYLRGERLRSFHGRQFKLV